MELTTVDRSDIRTRPRSHRSQRELAFWSGLGLAPAAIGVGIGALARSRRAGWIAGGLSVIGFAALRWQLDRLFNDEPDYVVEQRIGNLEIRRYLPRVEARTRMIERDFDAALEGGFERLAGYIFGANRAGEKLAMTSPVTARGEGLATTAPVVTGAHSEGHGIAFIMPPERAIASLPRPTDDRIELVEVPETRVAVLRYRGRYSGEIVADHARELCHLVRAAGLVSTSEPMFAGFDPPWTLPLLRRSEVWLELG